MFNLRNRSFLKELDFTAGEFVHVLAVAASLKTAKYAGTEVRRLEGKELALIFVKTSTRTRSAFEVPIVPLPRCRPISARVRSNPFGCNCSSRSM